MKKNSLNFFNQKINFGGHPLDEKKQGKKIRLKIE